MKSLTGTIVSLKSLKTAVVTVEHVITHRLYKKQIKRMRKMKAHYEDGKYQVGDVVTIIETRPLSKDKHFRILTEKK